MSDAETKVVTLSEKQLDLGLQGLKHHGYGDFFPEPPEFEILQKNWPVFRKHLSTLDLEKYDAYKPIEISAPKSRINLRRVSLLPPFDAVIYNALVTSIRDCIASARVPESEERVYSFRSEGAPPHVLYQWRPSHPEFSAKVLAKATKHKSGFIALADIADFYLRLYQHRVRNAVEATITDPVMTRYAEIIEKRLLRVFSNTTSYGIPIGPAASRPLAEAALIDVDSALQSHGIDFVRYIDDFAIFGKSREVAEWGVRQLGEVLFSNHGLTLQAAKTRVLSRDEYVKTHTCEESEEGEVEREFNEIVEEHFYDIDSLDDLTEDQKETIDVMNFAEVLSGALDEEHVNYKKVTFILSKLSSLQNPDLIPIVLDNLKMLYPVAHSINEFFREFEHLPSKEQKKIGDALLAPLTGNGHRASEYYAVWILDLFARNTSWDHASTLMRIFRETESQVIRRYSALAIGKCGSRAEALLFKEHIGAAVPLTRTAILIGSAKLPKDERSHWRKSLRLADPFEKQIP